MPRQSRNTAGELAKEGAGQSALEYLMSYGWMLIVVVIIIAILVFIINPSLIGGETKCTGFKRFVVTNAKADTEKLQFVITNLSGWYGRGNDVYGEDIYAELDSPPLFQIEIGGVKVGSTVNTMLSNDYVVAEGGIIEGYKTAMGATDKKKVIIPWPVAGFGGDEFGAGGCDFFTNSLGKSFSATITVYYREKDNFLKKEEATCSGKIDEASEQYFPPQSWGC